MKNKKRIISSFTLFLLIFPFMVSALEVDFNNIISDEEAQDYSSMSQVQIKDFLREKDSFLANYWYLGNNPAPIEIAQDPEAEYFKKRSATEIIYNAAQEARINPKFLLVMLQKEQSLVENDNPTERNLDFAMGYYCFDGQPCNPKYKGFGKQVRSTALQFRWYLDNIHEYTYQPGKSVCIDDPSPDLPCTTKGTKVTPENKITASLYVYTPHIHGNRLFATIWDRYGFAGISGDLSSGILPAGALVKAKDSENGTIYLISQGQRRPFASITALVTRYDPGKILSLDQTEIEKYSEGPIIDFANYSVLQGQNGERYLIDGLKKRLIVSDEAFRKLGYNPAEVIQATESDLAAFDDSADLDDFSNPFGELYQDMTTGSVFYVKDGQRHPIIDETIMRANYPDLTIKEVTSRTLEDMRYGGPIKLADGTLIKEESHKNVYVISEGKRRLIPDGQTFESLGYQWSNIIIVPSKVFNLHQASESLPNL